MYYMSDSSEIVLEFQPGSRYYGVHISGMAFASQLSFFKMNSERSAEISCGDYYQYLITHVSEMSTQVA